MKIVVKAFEGFTHADYVAAVQAMFLSEFHQWRKMNPHTDAQFKTSKLNQPDSWEMQTPFNGDETYYMTVSRSEEKDYGNIRLLAEDRIKYCQDMAREAGFATSKSNSGRFQYVDSLTGTLAVTTTKVF